MRTIPCSILFLIANAVSGEIFFNVPQGLDPKAVQSSLLQLGITGYDPRSHANPAGLYPAAAGAKIFNEQLIQAGIPVAGVPGSAPNQPIAIQRSSPVIYAQNSALASPGYAQMLAPAAIPAAAAPAEAPANYHAAGAGNEMVAAPGAPGNALAAGAPKEEEVEYEEEVPASQQEQAAPKAVRQPVVPVNSVASPAAPASSKPEVNANLASAYQPNVAAAALTRLAVGSPEDIAAVADALADEAPKSTLSKDRVFQAVTIKPMAVPMVPVAAAVPSLSIGALLSTTTVAQLPAGVTVVTTTKPVAVATATLTATAPAVKITGTASVLHASGSASSMAKAGAKATSAMATATKVPAGKPAATSAKSEESEATAEDQATAADESAALDASSEAAAEGSDASADSEATAVAEPEEESAAGEAARPLRLVAAAAHTAFKPEDLDKFTFPAASLSVDLSGYSQLLSKNRQAGNAARTGSEAAFKGSQPAGDMVKTAESSSHKAGSASDDANESKESKDAKDSKDIKDTSDKAAELEFSSKSKPNAIVGPGAPITRDSSAPSLAMHTGTLAISVVVFALFL